MKNKYEFKAVIFGDQKSGKTAFFNSLLKKVYSPIYEATAGVEMASIDVGNDVRLKIIDTTGDEKYQCIVSTYLTRQDIYFLILDPFSDFNHKIKQARCRIKATNKYNPNACYVAVITKIDLLKTKAEQSTFEEKIKECLSNSKGEPTFKIAQIAVINNVGVDDLLAKVIGSVIQEKIRVNFKIAAQAICHKYMALVNQRHFMATDYSRYHTIKKLGLDLEKACTIEELKTCLIETTKEIRRPENGKFKYGITLFCGYLHIGSYKSSKLYQLINAELLALDPTIELGKLSAPPTGNSVVPLMNYSNNHR